MKIVWIGGNHIRHLYYGNAIHKKYKLSAAITVTREEMIPQPPIDLDENDRNNFIRHFKNRIDTERRYFGSQIMPDCPKLQVEGSKLNSKESVDFINKIKPDIAVVFGCGLIKEPLVSALPKQTINLHLGLSPRYRGAATLFWPFYFLEPNYAGSTFHYITAEPDAGDVIHQVTPKLEKQDHIHDVACKTVVASSQAIVSLLDILQTKGKLQTFKQKGTGKNFLNTDFRPEHLRVIYNLFNDDMVKFHLEGKLKKKDPQLIIQF